MTAGRSPAVDQWVEQARAVPIESELARRGIKLNGKVERAGPCPKCGGDDRFSINTAKQVFNCRQCGGRGDVIDLVRWLDGVDFIEACTTLAGPSPATNGKDAAPTARAILIGKHIYPDESGVVLFAVGRYEYQNSDGSFVLKDGKHKKSFRQKRPDPDRRGKWINNIDGVRVVPYKLPELIKAIANDHSIAIVEGEAKVDLLWSWNVPATCNAGGAGKWKPEHSAFLRGADVVIIPDNDDPGRNHAELVGASLQGIAKSVRVLELPELPPKGDIIDWAKAGGTVEQLYDLSERIAKQWAPRYAPGKTEGGNKNKGNTEEEVDTLESVRASDVKMKALVWMWMNRFALGKLGILAGLPDQGKGLILCYIAAQITRHDRESWPCNEGVAPEGNVILLTAEDDPGDTVVPRLAAAGANLTRIHIVKMVHTGKKRRMFSLITDLELLRRKITEIGGVVLVLIDPVSAYMGHGKIDNYRTTDVRAVLAPLIELARELRISMIGIMHFNKKTDVTNALLRISDSLAYGAAARHVYGVVDDAENKRKLMVRAKNNLSAHTVDKALAYNFSVCSNVGKDEDTGETISAPYIIWEPKHVDVTATEAMAAANENKSPVTRDAAKKFLLKILANGPVAKKEIDEAAEANCISDATLRRAKDELNVEAEKDRTSPNGPWTWHLPNQPKHWARSDNE